MKSGLPLVSLESVKDIGDNNQISGTLYYLLPCGKYLEDFIYARGLNFNEGSALKYLWRAGKKNGESKEKDLKKAQHYINFESECRRQRYSDTWFDVATEVEILLEDAKEWDGLK